MCRKSGLEQKRRCGWLGLGEEPGAPPVWARRHVVLGTCPKSYITAESAGYLEEFSFRRRFGRMDLGELTARQAEAFVILEHELATEIRNGEQRPRNAF
jgi:hypothetical protein